MIENLFQLVQSAGVERLHLSIQPSKRERVAVCIQCILGDEPDKATEDQQSLRQALSVPIIIEGIAGEVDAKLDVILNDYVKKAVPLSDRLLTNADQVKRELSKVSAANLKEKAKVPEAKADVTSGLDPTDDDNDSEFASSDATSL
ncbi:MAG: hypothetical protein EOO52_13210 [Gammaproteobacteria bacterium]|nr:MAG: hypothetical protein EOO52_13210 [Gammaproteobacteria bacterium]